MSAILIKQGNGYVSSSHVEYQIASASDITSLPTSGIAVGSIAYTADMTSMWNFGQDNAWHKIGG